jgi:DNA mismatch repair protein MutL
MPEIRQLSPSVVNKIAAGEVIERPASAVKELVENSVDSGATRVDVTVEQGGGQLIRVVDNGCGIQTDQLLLAVASHATSKIRDADDLFRVSTLGFRGEALASIAEISQFRIVSRPTDADSAAELEVLGGQAQPIVPCGAPVGTTIEVRNLFYNTPVRRKFMRTVQTELGHISEAFLRIALPHPRVHFTLRHNDRVIHDLPPVESWRERIIRCFGEELAENLIWVENRDEQISLSGYVGNPNYNRANNRLQYLFLNGRFIRDRSLQHALGEAYRGLLMQGRFPVALLRMELPPEVVDVNVHPTKLEVRFQDGSRVYSQTLSTIRNRFLATDLTAKVKPVNPAAQASRSADATSPDTTAESGPDRLSRLSPAEPPVGGSTSPRSTVEPAQACDQRSDAVESSERGGWPGGFSAENPPTDRSYVAWARGDSATQPAEQRIEEPPESDWSLAHPAQPARTTPLPFPELSRRPPTTLPDHFQGTASQSPDAPSSHQFSPVPGADSGPVPSLGEVPSDPDSVRDKAPLTPGTPVRPSGRSTGLQVHNRYLVAEGEEGILVIDQHALHERVLYEQLREKILSGRMETQRLLVPEPVTLSPVEAGLVLDHQETLAELGILTEPFGGDTVLVVGYPAMLHRFPPAEILRQAVELLISGNGGIQRRDLIDELLHMMSCKAAVKAGDPLSSEEVLALLAHRELCLDSHHCPHGRPTALVFTREELDKRFGRT